MTTVLVVALLAVVAAAFVLVDRKDARQRDERRELMNRVQRPELLPLAPAPRRPPPEPELDELHLVGAMLPAPEDGSS